MPGSGKVVFWNSPNGALHTPAIAGKQSRATPDPEFNPLGLIFMECPDFLGKSTVFRP
jgi:hypothetical protein